MYFYYFYLFLQPYLLKYLLTLFPFHKVTEIYTPIHVKAGEEDGGMWLGRGWGLDVWDEPSPARFISLLRTIPPLIQPLKGSRFNSIWSLFSESASLRFFYTPSGGHVSLGSCQQRGGEIYVLVLDGARAFDPCSVIFYGVRDTTRWAAPFPSREKKRPDTRVLDREEWRESGKKEERKREVKHRKMKRALHSFHRAENRKLEGSMGINQLTDQWID